MLLGAGGGRSSTPPPLAGEGELGLGSVLRQLLGPLLLLHWSWSVWQPQGRAVTEGRERAADAPRGHPCASRAAVPSLQDGVQLGAGAGSCMPAGEGWHPGWGSAQGDVWGPCQAPTSTRSPTSCPLSAVSANVSP